MTSDAWTDLAESEAMGSRQYTVAVKRGKHTEAFSLAPRQCRKELHGLTIRKVTEGNYAVCTRLLNHNGPHHDPLLDVHWQSADQWCLGPHATTECAVDHCTKSVRFGSLCTLHDALARASATADNETGPSTTQTAGKDPSNKAEEGKQ